jgi:hypothetical protein
MDVVVQSDSESESESESESIDSSLIQNNLVPQFNFPIAIDHNPDLHLDLAPCVLNILEWERQLKHSNYEHKEIILDYLINGADIGLIPGTHFSSIRLCRNLISAQGTDNRNKLLDEMIEEVRLGRRAGPFSKPPFDNFQCSPIGTVPKKRSTKLRTIHHLSYPRNNSNSSINSQIQDYECEYLRFDQVVDRIRELGPTCLLSKFDIKNAFKYIRVRKDQQSCLGMFFTIDRKRWFFYERVVPFGLKSAPAIFELFATAINHFLTYAGVKDIRHYLDDFIAISLPETAETDYQLTIDMFKKLNVDLSFDKVVKTASSVEFLGINIDCKLMQISLPEDKLISYRNVLQQWRYKHWATRTELQSLIGKLVHASKVIRNGNTFYQSLLQLLRNHSDIDYGLIKITDGALLDINWWYKYILDWNGISLIPPSIDQYLTRDQYLLYTDASITGMGGYFNNCEYVAHTWTANELNLAHRNSRESMPYLELLALVHCINIWKNNLSGKGLIINCDCMPVVQSINLGRSFKSEMMELIRTLLYITNKNNIFVKCIHIKTKKKMFTLMLYPDRNWTRSSVGFESKQ